MMNRKNRLFASIQIVLMMLLASTMVAGAQQKSPASGSPSAPARYDQDVTKQAGGGTAPLQAVGTGFTYQGKLTNGGAAANGQFDFIFTLWDTASAGASVASPVGITAQPVTDGLFTVTLDFGAGAFQGQARWLEIQARPTGNGFYATLSPRQQLSPAPYAMSLVPGAVVSGTLGSPLLSLTNTGSGNGLYSESANGVSVSGISTNGIGLYGSSVSASGRGVQGSNTNGIGVYGSSVASNGVYGNSAAGTGVYGTSGSASGYGVHGFNGSGIGVYGSSTSSTGVWGNSSTGTGVHGWSNSASGYGVQGINTSGTGVYGTSNNSAGYGVRGSNNSGTAVYGLSDSSNGVWGESSNGWGVYGTSSGSAGVRGESVDSVGVYGSSTGGFGVRGDSGESVGVYGTSSSGSGMLGSSSTSNGVRAISTSGYGLWASSTSNNGVFATSSNNVAIYGTSVDVTGVMGQSNSGVGVRGSTGSGTGVWGSSSASNGVLGSSTSGKGVYGSTGGGSTVAGVHGWSSGNEGNGVIGEANNGSTAYGVWGKSTSGYAGYFSGNVQVQGTLSKSAGSFKIDHPLDPANKYLSHSFVESPDMMNIYNGEVTLDGKGEAAVEMPAWFEALNQEFRYQLTAVGAPGPNLHIAQKITNNRFKIAGGTAGMEVSWQVTGVRHDPYAEQYRIPVEQDKPASERGYYLRPELYGQPAGKAVESARPGQTAPAGK
jgi:hypothetical protein